MTTTTTCSPSPMLSRADMAALLLRSRKRRRAEGAHVCLACGADTFSSLRSWCPPCKLERRRAFYRERERTRSPRVRVRVRDIFPETSE